jgi:hypothetical protein
MDLVFYSPVNRSAEERLQRVVESVLPAWGGPVCRTLDDLSERLLQPNNELTITCLLAAKKEDIKELLPLSNLFRNTRIILIVPDWDKETLAAAHQLRPRLLTHSDSDFAEVFTVLTKMKGDYQSPQGM